MHQAFVYGVVAEIKVKLRKLMINPILRKRYDLDSRVDQIRIVLSYYVQQCHLGESLLLFH